MTGKGSVLSKIQTPVVTGAVGGIHNIVELFQFIKNWDRFWRELGFLGDHKSLCTYLTVTRYYLVQFWLGWTAMMPRWKRAWEVFMLHFGALINIFLKFRCIKTIDKWKRSIFVSINRMWNITRRIIKFDRTSWKTAAVAGFVHFLFSYLPLKCIHISLTFTPCVILCQLQMALQFLCFHQKNIVRV